MIRELELVVAIVDDVNSRDEDNFDDSRGQAVGIELLAPFYCRAQNRTHTPASRFFDKIERVQLRLADDVK